MLASRYPYKNTLASGARLGSGKQTKVKNITSHFLLLSLFGVK